MTIARVNIRKIIIPEMILLLKFSINLSLISEEIAPTAPPNATIIDVDIAVFGSRKYL